MQSLYRVIKSTVVDGNNIIAPPEIILPTPASTEPDNLNDIIADDIPNEFDIMYAEAKKKIDDLLSAAREEAVQIIENANIDAANLRSNAKEEGYQEGYRNGYKDGYDLGMNEAVNDGNIIRQEAETYLKSTYEEVSNYISKSKNEIIKLSTEIARHILNTELTINSDAIYKITEKAVSSAVDKKQLVIKVNPDDFNYLKNKKDELSIYVEDSSNIFIIADPSIKHTSIKIESPSGFVDASIDTQLDIILKSLTGDGCNA